MKNKVAACLVTVAALLLSSAVFADGGAGLETDVSVRQRWPWSGKVDIDYTYTGSVVTSILITATWQGQTTPVNLVALADTGTFSVAPGTHRFTWDPAAAGYDGKTLVGFEVSVTPGVDPRTYLILDLVNGGYSTVAERPASGWSDDQKRNKMVFRRVPAGTYTLGTEQTDIQKVWTTWSSLSAQVRGNFVSGTPTRQVTLTSDFYLAVFPETQRQYQAINGTNNSNAMTPVYVVDDARLIRGATLADGVTAVDWPTTGYRVSATSYIGKLRAKSAKKGQPQLLIDLPSEAQWEVAMRAGGTGFFPNGGTTDNTLEELRQIFEEIAWLKATTSTDAWSEEVGRKSPTEWGFYDMYTRGELTLDWANDHGYYSTSARLNMSGLAGGTDPVGPTSSAKNYRVRRSNGTPASWAETSTSGMLVSYRDGVTIPSGTGAKAAYNGALRFAIHLKPLQDLPVE